MTVLLAGAPDILGASLKVLPGYVPREVAGLKPIGRPPASNQLHLAIGLPLRDPAGSVMS